MKTVNLKLDSATITVARGSEIEVNLASMTKEQVMDCVKFGIARYIQNALIPLRNKDGFNAKTEGTKAYAEWLKGERKRKGSTGLTATERRIFIDLMRKAGAKKFDADSIKATWNQLADAQQASIRKQAEAMDAAQREALKGVSINLPT